MTVDAGAVGALEVGENDPPAVFLNLDVKAADALVIELNGVVFFRDRS